MSKASYYIWMHLISIILVLTGALNWLFIGAAQVNVVQYLTGQYEYIIYILVGIAGVRLLLQRNTFLPYLGWSVLPKSIIKPVIPENADIKIVIDAPKNAEKVIYWSANKGESEDMSPALAYKGYNNAGVADVIDKKATIQLACPRQYKVLGKILPKHVHYRYVMNSGFISDVRTQSVQC